MGEHIERLAQFVAQTQWEDIPAPVQRHTKLVLLDTLGVILAGGERPEVRQLRERLAGTAGTGATVYARGWPTHDPRTAALLTPAASRPRRRAPAAAAASSDTWPFWCARGRGVNPAASRPATS